MSDITRLLLEAEGGGRDALERVLPLLYDELHAIARRQMGREGDALTLDATSLLHEACLKLLREERAQWQGREHILAVASTVMRRYLVSHARERGRAKRGGGQRPLGLTAGLEVPTATGTLDVLVVDDILRKLEQLDARAAQVLECRVFGGLTIDETARALGVSPMTVKRHWAFARSWLQVELDPN